MKIFTDEITLKTKGNADIIDITGEVKGLLKKYGASEGHIVLFVRGSTAGLTTMEFEPNLAKDIRRAFDKIAPEGEEYAHHMTWGDHNGHSHVRASLLGPSITVPFKEKNLVLGTWQQIVLIDFDTSSRSRSVTTQIICT